MNNNVSQLDSEALRDLAEAKYILENPSLAARITNSIGQPIEKGLDLLSDSTKAKISKYTQAALLQASDVAIFSVSNNAQMKPSSNRFHKLGVAVTGGVGGFFGLAGLALELPTSTTIMLRSIADIARSQGEPIQEKEGKLACLEVLALGGPTQHDDATESGYYAVRAMLANSVSAASRHLATKGLSEEGAPVIMRLITTVAQRFGIQVSEKAAAQAIPLIGAASGAIINTIFMDHFQQMAKGHFTIRRLERTYGTQTIKEAYTELGSDNPD